MYIWLRMFRLFVVCIWQKRRHGRESVFATTIYHTRAWPNDLDFNGHVNNGRINTLADLGRMHYFVRTGILSHALSMGARPMVGDITAKYRKEIKAFDHLEIHTKLLGWEGKWGFIEHRILRDGQIIGNVLMRGVFRARTGSVDPEAFLTALEVEQPQETPKLPEWALEWHRSMEGMSVQLRSEEKPR
jgi:acyl-CoA thioesterase FadM